MFDLSRFDLSLFEESAGRAASPLRLLANEKRLMVLCQLADGELRVGDLQARVGHSGGDADLAARAGRGQIARTLFALMVIAVGAWILVR